MDVDSIVIAGGALLLTCGAITVHYFKARREISDFLKSLPDAERAITSKLHGEK